MSMVVLVIVVLWGLRVELPPWLCGLAVVVWLLVDWRLVQLERRRQLRAARRRAWRSV